MQKSLDIVKIAIFVRLEMLSNILMVMRFRCPNNFFKIDLLH